MRPIGELRDMGKRPQRHLGQNFLVDPKVIHDMVAAAEISSEEIIVEIGPGTGALTYELAKVAKRVIAIEADRDLADDLRSKTPKNVTIITGDALQINWTLEIEGDYKIVANIPYSLTSPLLRKVFLLEEKPQAVVLLIQKEMAERIVAEPGNSDRGFLTLLTEANARAKIIRSVKPGSFRPMPQVESAIIAIKPFEKSRAEEVFWPAVEAGFRHKRQTLVNALSKELHLPKPTIETSLESLSLDKLVRAQALDFDGWVSLSQVLKSQ